MIIYELMAECLFCDDPFECSFALLVEIVVEVGNEWLHVADYVEFQIFLYYFEYE